MPVAAAPVGTYKSRWAAPVRCTRVHRLPKLASILLLYRLLLSASLLQSQMAPYYNNHGRAQQAAAVYNRDQSSTSSLSSNSVSTGNTNSSSSNTSHKNSNYTVLLKEMAKQSDIYLERKGYQVTQHNGQRVSILQGVSVPDDKICREVFVAKIPRDMLEIELMPIMEQVGTVYKMRLMMDFSCGNRGYAFVMYLNPSDAVEACRVLDGLYLRPDSDKKIGVCPSIDNKRLWMGKLPACLTKDRLLAELNKVVDGIGSVHLPDCSMKNGSRYAVIEFKTHDDATKARRVLCPGTVKIMGRKIQVDWAKPEKPIMRPAEINNNIFSTNNNNCTNNICIDTNNYLGTNNYLSNNNSLSNNNCLGSNNYSLFSTFDFLGLPPAPQLITTKINPVDNYRSLLNHLNNNFV